MNDSVATARVLEQLDDVESEIVADTIALVRIPSVGGSDAENDAQQHMAGVLARGGLEVDHWRIDLDRLYGHPEFPGVEVERREAWGVVGRLPGTGGGSGGGGGDDGRSGGDRGGGGGGRSLMLNGHVDVVPIGDPEAWNVQPFAGEIVGGRIFGRGACDMKAGLIAAHWAVQAIRRSGVRLRGDVLIAPVQGEEDGGLGTFALLERGWRADACVIPEPTDLDIVPANAGALTFRVRVPGHATHASRRTDGVSAIEKFWLIWQALAELERRRHAEVDPMASRWALAHPLSIGTLQAGDWASSVPDLLVAEGRLGVALGEPVEHARAELEVAVADASAADPWLREHPAQVEWWGGQFASGRLPASSDLVERVGAAHRAASGARPHDVWAAPYGSDLRLLIGRGRIATVQYGPGDSALAHAPDESVPIADIVLTARTLALVALSICGHE